MLRSLSRIVGVTGGALSLLANIYVLVLSVYSLTLPDGIHSQVEGYVTYCLFSSIAIIAASLFCITGALSVCETPVYSGVVMIIYGIIELSYGAPFILLGTAWLSMLPSLLVIASGTIALLSIIKPSRCKSGNKYPQGAV